MRRKSRLERVKIERIIEHFVAGTPARSCALLCEVSRKTTTKWYHQLRLLIHDYINKQSKIMSGEIEVDESYFGGKRKGKRGRGSVGKKIVFGLYKRNGYVHTLIVSNTRTLTLYKIIKE